MKRWIVLAGIPCAALVVLAPAARAAEKDYLIVARGQGVGSTAIDDRIVAAGGVVTQRWEELGLVVASSANPSFLAQVSADPRVHGVAEDVEVPWIPKEAVAEASVDDPEALGVNSEPFWGYQWNIRQIGADRTAAAGYRGHGARVAVVDAGCWATHPDLAPNVNTSLSTSFVPGEASYLPGVAGFNHGTHVSGIIAAAINNLGVQGVAPEAELVCVKVLRTVDTDPEPGPEHDNSGSGSFSWIIGGILYAASIDADVINMSLGATFDRINQGGSGAGPLIAALNRAVNYATAAGVLVVSAAGNEAVNLNSRLWSIPAQSGNGMAVAATGPCNLADFDRAASYTNYGQSVVNVAAPGGDAVCGTSRDMVASPASATGYYFAAGTSMAAPHVSGLAALLVGAYGKLPPARLRALIERSAVDILKPGADPYSGKGRIDAARALGVE